MPGPADEARRAMIRGALRGLSASIDDLQSRSVPLAPIEEGVLRASTVITFIVNGQRFQGAGAEDQALAAAMAALDAGDRLEMTAELSYNQPYAQIQHERLDFQHPRGGQAKYLEQPLLEMAGRYQRVIAASAERELRRA